MCVLEKPLIRGSVIAHPPMCRPVQQWGPSPEEERIHSSGGVIAHQSTPKGVPKPCTRALQMMQQTLKAAKDSVKPSPNRRTMDVPTCPKHALIHGILYSLACGVMAWVPHYQEDQMEGVTRWCWDPQMEDMLPPNPCLSLSLCLFYY